MRLALCLLMTAAVAAAADWQGPGAAEPVDGRGAHRWALADGDTLTLPLGEDAGAASTLRLDVHSARMTGAKMTLRLLAPDAANAFEMPFSVEWTGWAPLWFERGMGWREVGDPGWAQLTALQISGREGFAPPTVLHLADPFWTDDSPQWPMPNRERLIEPMYNGMLAPLDRWSIDGGRLDRRWNAMAAYRPRGAATTLSRPLDLDLSGLQAIRLQAALPRDVTLALRGEIDGRVVELAPPAPGSSNWAEYRGAVSGRRLTRLFIDLADAPGAPAAGQTEAHFHFLTAEEEGFAPPTFPDQRPTSPLPEALPEPRAALEAAGVPVWLYFGRDDVGALREKVKSGAPADMLAQIVQRADGYLGYDPMPYVHSTFPQSSHEWLRPWTPSQPWGDVLETCAFAYVLTGEPRYAEQARRVLLAMAATPDWTYGFVGRYPKGWGGHGGPFSEASNGSDAALAYNWIHNTLSDEERRAIEETMLWGSWYWLNDYIDTRDYIRAMNQGPWFNYGALIQALVLRESYPFVAEQLAKYEANVLESIALNYKVDGATTEGPAYWAATTDYVVRALPLLAHHLNKPLAGYVPAPLARSLDLPIYLRSMANLDGWYLLGINDSHYGRFDPGHIALFFAGPLQQANALWVWEQTAGRTGNHRDRALSVIWYPSAAADAPGLAPPALQVAKHFDGVDWLALRSGWDPGAVFFFLQSGAWGHGGHQHHDKNSFVLEAYGERLLPDLGVPTYGDPRGPWFQSTVAHNAITLDGANQRPGPAELVRFEHTDGYDRIVSDATALYPGAEKVVRRVLYRRPNWFVVADEVRCAEPRSIESNLHTPAQVRGLDSGLGGLPRFVLDGARADLHVVLAAPSVVRASVAESSPGRDTYRHVQLATPRPSSEAVFLMVLCPVPEGEEPPPIEVLRDAGGATIRVGDDTVRYALNEDLRLVGEGDDGE